MRYCPSCSNKFGFSSLLKSVNPVRMTCDHCGESIRVSGFQTFVVVLFSLLAGFFLMAFVVNAMGSVILSLVSLAMLGLAFEYVFYKLLISGIVKSNLVSM